MANHARPGRPMKGKSRRTPITVHAPVGLLDTIDQYVQEQNEADAGAFSRSDFFCDAALMYLRHLGFDTAEVEVDVRGNRTKSVPEKSIVQDSGENTDKQDNENR